LRPNDSSPASPGLPRASGFHPFKTNFGYSETDSLPLMVGTISALSFNATASPG
jgi:hypothetical protein